MNNAELGSVIFSPRGGGGGGRKGVWLKFVFCVHILPPAQTIDHKTFKYDCVTSVHSGDAIGSFV